MPTLFHGKNNQGFAVLDSLITVLILSLALSSLFSVFTNLLRSSGKQTAALEELFNTISERESSSWTYSSETANNETE